MSRERIANGLLLAAVFLLPWQTRWIYAELTIGGEVWEYGKLSLYAVELLVLVTFVLRGRPRLSSGSRPLLWSALTLVVLALVFSIVSVDFTLSLASWVHLALATIFFLLLLDERTRISGVVWAFILSLVLPSILGWYQVVAGTSWASSWLGLAAHTAPTLGDSVVEIASGRILRAYGSFPHPNVFGGFLVIGLFFLAWLARQHRFEKFRWETLALTVLFTATLMITFSRSTYLALAVGAVALALWLLLERRAPPRYALPLLTAALFSLLVTLVIFHEPIFARFNPALRLESRSIAERQSGYREAWEIVRAHPLVGAGVGAYTRALALARPSAPAWSYQPVHNVFALVLAELGIIGLTIFLFFLFRLFRPLFLSRRTPEGIFGLSLLAVLFVLAFFDHYLWSLWPGLTLGLLSLAVTEKMISKAS